MTLNFQRATLCADHFKTSASSPRANPRAFKLLNIGSFKFPPPPPPPGQNCVQMPYLSARFVCQMPLQKNKSFWWVVELLCCSRNKSFARILPRSSRCDNLLSPGCNTRKVTGCKCYLQIYLLFDEGCCS